MNAKVITYIPGNTDEQIETFVFNYIVEKYPTALDIEVFVDGAVVHVDWITPNNKYKALVFYLMSGDKLQVTNKNIKIK